MSEPAEDGRDWDFDDGGEDDWIVCHNCNGRGREMEGWPCEECDGAGGWSE